jgi:hypothetical protein
MNSPLGVLFGQPDEVARLARFRRAHPDVLIGVHPGWQFWQAVIPGLDGERIVTRYQLKALLDVLESLAARRA